jgi:hypothetical protein
VQIARHAQQQFALAVKRGLRGGGVDQSLGQTDQKQALVPLRVPQQATQHGGRGDDLRPGAKFPPRRITLIGARFERLQHHVVDARAGRHRIEKAP